MQKNQFDILIIGAGVIGSSVAMNLAQHEKNKKGGQSQIKIGVIDFDLEGTFSSSELNAGGVRATFFNEVNARYSKASIEYFEKHQEEVGYRNAGYLWLYSEERMQKAQKAYAIWERLKWPFEVWDFNRLQQHAPFIDKEEGIKEIVFAPRDGLVNPNRLKNHYREKAIQSGVSFEDRIWVKSAEYKNNKIFLKTMKYYNKPLELSEKKAVLTEQPHDLQGREVIYEANTVVNCAGAWAPHLSRILGYEIPSYPVRRQVCLFDCQGVDLTPYGMIVDASGVYFHPEATHGLAGFANPDEPQGVNFEYDMEGFFMEKVWPALYERSTNFERLKHITGWGGLYEVSPDHMSILGKVDRGLPVKEKVSIFDAHSFSGHGVMHSYAAGVALADLIFQDDSQIRALELPVEPLSVRRFDHGVPTGEGLVI